MAQVGYIPHVCVVVLFGTHVWRICTFYWKLNLFRVRPEWRTNLNGLSHQVLPNHLFRLHVYKEVASRPRRTRNT
jgi:hypothetical protein